MKVPLIKIQDIPNEGTTTVDFFGREVLVMKVEGKPKAVMNACLHLGGPLQRDGEKMVCQWHGAAFACEGGHRLAGPARPETRLMFLPTRIEDDTLTYVYGE